ncbi:MAG TPA: hypothetical protein VM103_00620 [Candidatus Paceibacterota bacterium]|nr:hypothetical protein [Candidatus Paceibacterota bacterium]
MEHDAWFFFGIFAFIFIIWIATGGPTHPLSFTGPSLSLPGALGGGTYLSLPRAPLHVGDVGGTGSGNPSNGGSGGTGGTTDAGSAFGTPSVYRGKITLGHSISGAGAADPNTEYIKVALSQNAGTRINISGWVLQSGITGYASNIPYGAEVPRSGVVNVATPIILAPGQSAIVDSGHSPIGISFRENKCIGYLAEFQNFYPGLPRACPTAATELATFNPSLDRNDACHNFARSVSRCKTPRTSTADITTACKNFVDQYLNYNGCVDAHKNDADFAGTTWHIYLSRFASLWQKKHEVVKLLDSDGKTVDVFTD